MKRLIDDDRIMGRNWNYFVSGRFNLQINPQSRDGYSDSKINMHTFIQDLPFPVTFLESLAYK